MSNDNDQIIEDVEEKELIESEVEVSEETEVTEPEQPLSDTVLDVLLGEAKNKNEAEEDESEEDDIEEGAHEYEVDDDELEEAKKVSEEDDEEEEEVSEGAHEDEDEEEVEEEEDDEELEEGAHEDEDEEEVEEGEHSDEDEEETSEEESDEDEVELPEVQTKAGYLAASFDALKGMKKSELVSAYKIVNPIKEDETEEGYHEEMPNTKADLINAMYGQLKAMKKDPLMATYKNLMASHCESVKEETEANLFADDLKVLANADQELTEDFKAKASILFEAAVANKVQSIQEDLESQYAEDLQEEVSYVRESLVEKIDDYLSFVVESWIEENQEFVDNKLRTEITEDFMKALQGVFTEHYIEVPESKVDLVDELSDQVADIKESLATSEAEKSELAKQVEILQREKVITEATSDLASTQASKLSSLVEEAEFVDVETFAAKVATIKEGFFKESTEEEVLTEKVDSANEVKTIVEGQVDPASKLPADMARYVQQLSKFKK